MKPGLGSPGGAAFTRRALALTALGIHGLTACTAREIEFIAERHLTTGVRVLYRCPHPGGGGEDRLTHHRLPMRAGTSTGSGVEALGKLMRAGGAELTVLRHAQDGTVPFAIRHPGSLPTVGVLWTSADGSLLEIVEVTLDPALAGDEALYERHASGWLGALGAFAHSTNGDTEESDDAAAPARARPARDSG